MKALLSIFITIGLLTTCYAVSALIYFDLSWILVGITSLWAGIDSKKIELNRYKSGIACRPIALFCLCYLLWIIIFPCYLWERFKIKEGNAVLKDETLANIGPVKRFFRRISRIAQTITEWGLIGLVGLKIIFLFFCIEESWRGPRVWENYKHELEAKGETFDWDTLIPPRVPDSQNFFNAPMMSAWFAMRSGKSIITEDLSKRLNYSNTSPAVLIAEVTVDAHADSAKGDVLLSLDDFNSHRHANQLIHDIAGPSAFGERGNDILTAQSIKLNEIKPLRIFLEADKKPNTRNVIALFSGNNSRTAPLIFRPSGTNAWHVLTSFCAAPDYLRWSDQFKTDFELMREAIKRPYARMDGDYHNPSSVPIPNFANLRAISQTLAQRVQCYLLLGQPDKALQELTLLYNLRHLLEGAPTGKPMPLSSAMMNTVIIGLYADTIADGIRLHAWKESQLIVLQKQLEQIQLAPFLEESFREEEISAWRIMQTVMSQFEIKRVPNATFLQKIKNLRPPNILRGAFCFNVVNTVKLDQIIIDSIDLSQNVVSPQKAAEFQREVGELENLRHVWLLSPYKLLAAIAVPNFTKAVQTFAFNQVKADEAQIVCALERYHLARDKYPETLNELMPQFIDQLPHDIIGGQPLKYRRTSDGQFLLYSVGWNEKDDGGQFDPSYDQGDWVWQ